MGADETKDTARGRLALISPGAFRELDGRARERILAGVARFGRDHAMYVLVDAAGEVVRMVVCCAPDRPCRDDLFRIRRNMQPPVLAPRQRDTAPATPAPTSSRIALANEPESIPLARRFVDEALRSWDAEPNSAVGLVLSELVTNAVVHAHLVAVGVSIEGDVLRLEVFDDTQDPPRLREPDGLNGGYGLNLVNELSERWGWARERHGKRVWSELSASSPST